MPGFNFLCADAEELDIDKKFDVVVCHSLCQYFQDYDKARTVLEKMILKSNKVIGVFDVCDEEMKAQYHKERIEHFVKGGSTEAQYWEKYQNLDNIDAPYANRDANAFKAYANLALAIPNKK